MNDVISDWVFPVLFIECHNVMTSGFAKDNSITVGSVLHHYYEVQSAGFVSVSHTFIAHRLYVENKLQNLRLCRHRGIKAGRRHSRRTAHSTPNKHKQQQLLSFTKVGLGNK
jgi:hypothetical protein